MHEEMFSFLVICILNKELLKDADFWETLRDDVSQAAMTTHTKLNKLSDCLRLFVALSAGFRNHKSLV